MSMNNENWLIQADRLYCPYTGYDGPGTLAISGDRIVDAGTVRFHEVNKTHLLSEGVLLPGLIDLHAHPREKRAELTENSHTRNARNVRRMQLRPALDSYVY